jgi:hypothetical protein
MYSMLRWKYLKLNILEIRFLGELDNFKAPKFYFERQNNVKSSSKKKYTSMILRQ